MSLPWGHLFSGLALACLLGCGASSDPTIGDDVWDGPLDGVTIAFAHEGVLTLAPGEVATLTVTTEPPQPYEVSFYLLGNALDASLDDVIVIAAEPELPIGTATVELRAPNGATNFVVRATIKDGPMADLPVSVSAEGFGSLDVRPSYSGQRPIDAWRAFVVSGTTCEAISETFPEDPEGALTGSAEVGEPLIVESAPVGPNLVVFVRGERYAWGCSDEPALMAGETKTVVVNIVNKPVVTENSELDVEMTVVPEPDPWAALIADQRALMLSEFFAQQSTAVLLLAQMSALSTDPAAFDTASSQQNWLSQLQSHLTAHQVDIIAAFDAWLYAGMATQPQTIVGHVKGLANGHANFTVESVGGFAPAAIGSPEDHVMALTVDPNDTVHLGGTFYWLPSRHMGLVVEQEALAQTQFATFADVLSDLVACNQLTLTGFNGCNTSCMQQLCSAALADRWQLALDASANSNLTAVLPFEASGPSELDVEALLKAFQGDWLGEIGVGNLKTKVTGSIAAEATSEPAG